MRVLLLLLNILFVQTAFALNPSISLKLGDAEFDLTGIEKILSKGIEDNVENLQKYHTHSLQIIDLANECIEHNERSINKSADDLELLGAQGLSEENVITQKRDSLNKSMLANAQQLASCRLMLLRAKETARSSTEQQQTVLGNKLFTPQATIIDHLRFNLENPLSALSDVSGFIINNLENKILTAQKYQITGLSILVLLITFFIKKLLKDSIKKSSYQESSNFSQQIQLAVMSCTNHYLPIFLVSFVIAAYLFWVSLDKHYTFILILMAGISFLTVLMWSIRLFFKPCLPATLFIDIDPELGDAFTKRLRVLAWLLFIAFIMFFAAKTSPFHSSVIGLARNVFMAFLVLNLIWITLLLGRFNVLANTLFLRFILVVAIMTSLLSDWLGYANLSTFILFGLTGSVLIFLLGFVVSRLFTDFFNGFDEGRYKWQQHARKIIGVKQDDYIPGVIWIRFVGVIVIWSLCLVLAFKVWGLPDSGLLQLKNLVIDGFPLGSVNIIPSRVLMALISFSLMVSLVGWVKRRLDKSWLNRSRMDRGAKEAMISLTGYFGMAIVLLVSLSIAGVELANVALIAGALSVGIGFGLQNIVNNFVSGVILLFERPIKTGDWVQVGNTEGYVRKISIRSTQIQTFDRSDVLVPNSELISGQVTNWMLKDNRGRLIVPIGVAYGTNAEKVEAILLGIAEANPEVIKNSPILSDPYVLFKAFADSSLNFELRCFLVNVDIRMRVLSDINFEINKQFSLHNIEIPFPQRDINIKHAPLADDHLLES
ncbi:MAG: mechanosensitive ion channel family protein [Gammaproteobacteria bacterium]|nr:mechanosensitive ion channel family protein [Gammaproteobacteria bacterium]